MKSENPERILNDFLLSLWNLGYAAPIKEIVVSPKFADDLFEYAKQPRYSAGHLQTDVNRIKVTVK